VGITRGQKSTLNTTGSALSLATTWGTNPAAGSTILVFLQCEVGAPTSVVDNGATVTTFTQDAATATGEGAYVYRANNIKLPGAGSYAVTVNVGTARTMGLMGIEYIGVRPGPPHATNTGSATSTAVTTNAVTGENGGLFFGGFSDASSVNPETMTFNSGSTFTEQGRIVNGSAFWPYALADGQVGSGGSQSMSWTLGDSVAWGAVIATYRAQVAPVTTYVAVHRSFNW
jgi:hypothetical protein